MTLLLPALLVVAAPPGAAMSDERELVFDDIQGGGLPLLFDAALALRYTTTAGAPRATLLPDPQTGRWRIDSLLSPQPRAGTLSGVASFAVELEASRELTLRALFDSGQLAAGSSLQPPLTGTLTSDGQPALDTVTSGAFIREIAARIAWGSGSVELGRFHSRVADGLVYDEFGTGATIDMTLRPIGLETWRIELTTVAVGHTFDELESPSPLTTLRIERELSFFESLHLFGSLFVDRNGILADALESAVAEQIIISFGPTVEQGLLTQLFGTERPSHGRLAYVGIGGNVLPLDGLSVRGNAVVAAGSVTVEGSSRTFAFDLRSWAGTLDVSYGLTENIGIGGMAFALSGGRALLPFDARGLANEQHIPYRSFLAVAPYWTWTGLFFSGGLNQGLYPGRATAAGVNGHGVTGGGPRFELSTDDFMVELRGAYLHAITASLLGGSRRSYGIEIDVIIEWDIFSWGTLAVEIDVLRPGNFFVSSTPAFRAIGQFYVHTGT
ncbi:MAG: hypothetical protein V3T05_06175 [Myxococcota bacterium]